MKPSVVFLQEQLRAAAGTERISTGVMNELADRGYQVVIVLFGTDKTSAFPLNDKIKILLIGIPFENKYKLKAAFYLKKIINEIKPDYVINVAVPMMQVSFLAKCLGMKGKVVIWDHFTLFAGSQWGVFFRIFSAFVSHQTIVLTEQDRNSYPRLLRKKIRVIGNFVMDAKFKSNLMSKKVLSVGRLVHTKGFDILLDIWGDISKRHSDWILQIVGSGEEKENLRKKIEELHLEENVQMIPTVKNIEDYYIDASIYVSAARLEPWGLVLAEAKSFGLPIVCFDCPHGPKNIVRDGMDGNLIALNDCNEMKEKILLLMDDLELRRKYGEAARKDFECRFSKRAIFNKWTELLK